MNTKNLLAAAALALIATSSMATEATEFSDPVSTATTAAVNARRAAQTTGSVVVANHEATNFVDKAATVRSRADVRAEARAAARDLSVNELYVGA